MPSAMGCHQTVDVTTAIKKDVNLKIVKNEQKWALIGRSV